MARMLSLTIAKSQTICSKKYCPNDPTKNCFLPPLTPLPFPLHSLGDYPFFEVTLTSPIPFGFHESAVRL